MSLRKPILKVTRDCLKCKGSGQKTIKGKRPDSYFKSFRIVGKYMYIIIDCPKCNGNGRIDVKQNDTKFKKYYQMNLKERIDSLTTEYRTANADAYKIGEELRTSCEESDRLGNKPGG